MLKRSDYELIEKIIKNDERMLKYLKCDAVLESQNSRFKDEISSYRACLENFESIQSTLHAVRTPKPVSSTQQSQLVADLSLDLDLKPKPPQDFDFDISKRDQPTGFF